MITASRWLPPLRFVSCPSTMLEEQLERLREVLTETGSVVVPAGIDVVIVAPGQPRPIRPRTSLGYLGMLAP